MANVNNLKIDKYLPINQNGRYQSLNLYHLTGIRSGFYLGCMDYNETLVPLILFLFFQIAMSCDIQSWVFMGFFCL